MKRIIGCGCVATAIIVGGMQGCDKNGDTVYKNAPPVLETFILSQSLDESQKNAEVLLGSNDDEATFQCRYALENQFSEAEWQDCQQGAVSFPVEDGQPYIIEAAAHGSDGSIDKTPAKLQFIAQSVVVETKRTEGPLTVEGVDQLQQGEGEATLDISHEQPAVAFACLLNDAEIPCADGSASVDLDALEAGSYQLQVRALLEGEASDPVTINFCVSSCSDKAYLFSDKLQIGDFYELQRPENMHLTEYSTAVTTGPISFYRIMADSDEHYLGNTRCERTWDRLVETELAGKTYRYCHSTPTRLAYKLEYEYRMAYNHVEVATDAEHVADDNHERLSISVFDELEFTNARSRFYTFCKNSEIRSANLPAINDFFLGRNPEAAKIWYCDATIPNFRGAMEFWKVAALVEGDDLDWRCTDCSYPRVIETVYMARPDLRNWRDDYFVRTAQDKILTYITKIRP